MLQLRIALFFCWVSCRHVTNLLQIFFKMVLNINWLLNSISCSSQFYQKSSLVPCLLASIQTSYHLDLINTLCPSGTIYPEIFSFSVLLLLLFGLTFCYGGAYFSESGHLYFCSLSIAFLVKSIFLLPYFNLLTNFWNCF